MKMRARRSGGSRLRKQLRRLEPSLRMPIRIEMDRAGRELVAAMDAGAPKQTGEMAEAAIYKVSSDGLGVSAGYSGNQVGFKMKWRRGGFKALWAEFGTKHHAATPFIRPAYRQKLGGILTRIEVAVRDVIKGL